MSGDRTIECMELTFVITGEGAEVEARLADRTTQIADKWTEIMYGEGISMSVRKEETDATAGRMVTMKTRVVGAVQCRRPTGRHTILIMRSPTHHEI